MRRLIRARGVAVLLSFGLFLAACAPVARHAPNDQLVIAQQREPMALNPALENGASATEWGLLLFQYLLKFDDRGRLIADAAREVPISAKRRH